MYVHSTLTAIFIARRTALDLPNDIEVYSEFCEEGKGLAHWVDWFLFTSPKIIIYNLKA
jgi:hypothetical protein